MLPDLLRSKSAARYPIAMTQTAAKFTIRHSGYTSEVVTTTDDSAAHRELIALGFTCDRQDYGSDDSVIASYFHHQVNTHWTAVIARVS